MVCCVLSILGPEDRTGIYPRHLYSNHASHPSLLLYSSLHSSHIVFFFNPFHSTTVHSQCAELAKKGKVFATGTEDMDALTFATPKVSDGASLDWLVKLLMVLVFCVLVYCSCCAS